MGLGVLEPKTVPYLVSQQLQVVRRTVAGSAPGEVG